MPIGTCSRSAGTYPKMPIKSANFARIYCHFAQVILNVEEFEPNKNYFIFSIYVCRYQPVPGEENYALYGQ